MNNEEQMRCLKEFLLDLDCLKELEQSSFNMFDVLKIARTEIRHSNVLAWLMNPNENHGLGSAFLARLNAWIVQEGLVPDDAVFQLLTMNYEDVLVRREWQNIDILVVSAAEKYVLCIENKVDTQDHSGQLDKYQRIIESKYGDFTKIFLYLTPDGAPPLKDNTGVWKSIPYKTVILALEEAQGNAMIQSDVAYFIRSYLNTLRRETMENEEIVKLCQTIYSKHRQALDLIFENRPDTLENVSEYFKEWCRQKQEEGVLIWDKNKSNKSYTRFRTKFMDEYLLESSGLSGWNTYNHYYYEIAAYCEDGDLFYWMQLVFDAVRLEDENRAQLEKIYKQIHPQKSLKKGWKIRRVFESEMKEINEAVLLSGEMDDHEIYKNLDEMFESMLENEKLIAQNIV